MRHRGRSAIDPTYSIRGSAELVRAFDDARTAEEGGDSHALSALLGLCLRATHPVLVAWAEERRLFFNSAAAPLLGAPPDAFGKPCDVVLADAPEAQGALSAALAGENSSFAIRGKTFCCTPIDHGGRVLGVFCDAPAVTDDGEAREERFRTALRSAPVILSHQDLQLGYTWLHDPTEVWSPYGVQGKRDRELMDALDAEVIESLKLQVIESGIATRQEVRVRRGDVDCFFDLVVEPLRGAGGTVTGISCAAIDVTRHRLLEDKLRRQAKQLTEADRRKDEVLALLGHELRNPLSPIANGIHVLKLPNLSEALRTRTLAVMERQVSHMVRLLDDLLDVSRITRGKIHLRLQPVPIAQIVQNAIDTCAPFIHQRGHRLELNMPEQQLSICADSDRMTQVLSNLLHNAAKYTDEGGRITVSVGRWGGEVIIEVRDTGIGIAADLMPGIFDLFRQGTDSTERAPGGLGLGLAVVRRLIEMHGGSVAAFSAGPRQGSEFVVRLPLLADAPASAPALGPTCAPRRILVVDDNFETARSLALTLTARHHDVHCVHTPLAALHAVETFAPDAVLLDIELPGMDGYEVARLLRARPAAARLLLIAVTGYGDGRDGRRAEEAGFDHHVQKPVNIDTLQALFATYDSSSSILHP